VSFLTFALAQVGIDLESLFYLTRGAPPYHRHLHTYAGATVLAFLLVAFGKPAIEWFLGRLLPHLPPKLADFWELDTPISLRAAATGAVLGTYSHVLLDSVMHPDIRPLAPWNEANVLFEIVPLGTLHLACLGAGLGGLTLYALRRAWRPAPPGK
jgi:hypothetical protein